MLYSCQISNQFKVIILLPLFLFCNTSLSQSSFSFSKNIISTNTDWQTYIDKEEVLIEYCFQEDNPSRTYKGQYLVFKITNKSKIIKFISWDFSAVFNSEKCLNCNSDQEEFHLEKTLKPMSLIKGELTNHNKGPLVIFFRFTDERCQSKSNSTWESFELKNLTIR